MTVKRKKYTGFQLGSSIFMILALLWLTISLPFVVGAQMEQSGAKAGQVCPLTTDEEESCNPFSNTTEEKTPNPNSFSEEYLHDHNHSDAVLVAVSTVHKSEDDGTYIAFHGELLVPPPNFI